MSLATFHCAPSESVAAHRDEIERNRASGTCFWLDTHRMNTGEVYPATVSHGLNAVMRQLAVIATVFLPLTFVTGFLGRNFGRLVEQVGGAASFAIFGVGSLVVTSAALMVYSRRRGRL